MGDWFRKTSFVHSRIVVKTSSRVGRLTRSLGRSAMRNVYISMFFLLVFLICTCSFKELAEFDSEYVLVPEDIPNRPFAGLKVKPDVRGRPYNFIKSKTPLKEFSCLYTVRYENPSGKDFIEFQTQAGVLLNESRAKSLFTGSGILKNLAKDYIVKIDPAEYNASQVFCMELPHYLFLSIQRNRIFYHVTVDNISIREIDLREALRKKLDRFDDLVRLNKI